MDKSRTCDARRDSARAVATTRTPRQRFPPCRPIPSILHIERGARGGGVARCVMGAGESLRSAHHEPPRGLRQAGFPHAYVLCLCRSTMTIVLQGVISRGITLRESGTQAKSGWLGGAHREQAGPSHLLKGTKGSRAHLEADRWSSFLEGMARTNPAEDVNPAEIGKRNESTPGASREGDRAKWAAAARNGGST